MTFSPLDTTIKTHLTELLSKIEIHLDSDVISYTGPIINGYENILLKIIEQLAQDAKKRERILIILTSPGGSATTVERYVNIIRHHYKEVNFLVPDYAFSAGTIFCMSGDNIYMDYFSVLGPIDPQVQNKDGNLVAALGYLDKVNEMLKKAANNTLTNAEFLILKDLDLAELRGYEQAKELTLTLLKKWLVQYKFKNWATHRTDVTKIGQLVSDDEKREAAKVIADKLSETSTWCSHGRPINMKTLQQEIRLEIDDFGNDKTLSDLVRDYHNHLTEYLSKQQQIPIFSHTRLFI